MGEILDFRNDVTDNINELRMYEWLYVNGRPSTLFYSKKPGDCEIFSIWYFTFPILFDQKTVSLSISLKISYVRGV